MSLAPGGLIAKDPASSEPQGFDWTAWLARFATTELIVTSTWSVSGADAVLTVTSPSIVTGSLQTQAVLAAGTLGVEYTVTNHVVTTTGWIAEQSFRVLIENL